MSFLKRHPSHEWEDLSYHGSPQDYCRFCNVWDGDDDADKPCPKREEVLKQEGIKKEQEEQAEYKRMKRERERWEYLHTKYGNGGVR